MKAIYHIYGYLKHPNHSVMVFDDAMINWKDTDFTEFDWPDFYQDAKKNILQMPLDQEGIQCQVMHSWMLILGSTKIPSWYPHIFEYSPYTLVFEGSDHSRIIYIWF
jgi:hypothetical protein